MNSKTMFMLPFAVILVSLVAPSLGGYGDKPHHQPLYFVKKVGSGGGSSQAVALPLQVELKTVAFFDLLNTAIIVTKACGPAPSQAANKNKILSIFGLFKKSSPPGNRLAIEAAPTSDAQSTYTGWTKDVMRDFVQDHDLYTLPFEIIEGQEGQIPAFDASIWAKLEKPEVILFNKYRVTIGYKNLDKTYDSITVPATFDDVVATETCKIEEIDE